MQVWLVMGFTGVGRLSVPPCGIYVGSSLSGWAVIFALVATIVIFANAANWVILPGWLSFLEDTQTQSLIIVILVFALIIWFVTKEDKAKDPKKYSSIEDLGKILGYKKE